MLYPSMNTLMKKVNSRYMLVNVTAKRARQIADRAEQEGIPLKEKPVRSAINEIASDRLIIKSNEERE